MEIPTVLFLFLFSLMLKSLHCLDQAQILKKLLFEPCPMNKWETQIIEDPNVEQYNSMEDDRIVNGLPGQPFTVDFQQYAGYVTVDKLQQRSLFYYFVEATKVEPTTIPLILWFAGGPGCSSLGIGAMIEHGPFGVNPDGKTLYLRTHSWNQVANMLYLESPAGVGFSYSNSTSDYNTTGDARTARDSYIFLINWFQRFPQYNNVDFYIAGESYGGYYVPELAETILQNIHTHPTSSIKLRGIIVGNGLVNQLTDYLGMYDYLHSHALISTKTYKGVIQNCVLQTTAGCAEFQHQVFSDTEHIFLDNLYSEPCLSSNSTNKAKQQGSIHPCEEEYVITYLNNIDVQGALHVNRGKIPYAWTICHLFPWRDTIDTVFPIYEKLFAAEISVLLYSGDIDALVPFTSTQYSIEAMNLSIKKPWRPWLDPTKQVCR